MDSNTPHTAQDEYITQLQNELAQTKKDQAALASELRSGDDNANATAVREAVLPHVPRLIANMMSLADNAESESVMLSANKVLVEWVVGGKLGGKTTTDDSFRKLMTNISKQANTSQPQVQPQKPSPFKNAPVNVINRVLANQNEGA